MEAKYKVHQFSDGTKDLQFESPSITLADLNAAIAIEWPDIDPAKVDIYPAHGEDYLGSISVRLG